MVSDDAADIGKDKHVEIGDGFGDPEAFEVNTQALVEVGREPIHEDIEGIMEGEIVDNNGPHRGASDESAPRDVCPLQIQGDTFVR